MSFTFLDSFTDYNVKWTAGTGDGMPLLVIDASDIDFEQEQARAVVNGLGELAPGQLCRFSHAGWMLDGVLCQVIKRMTHFEEAYECETEGRSRFIVLRKELVAL